MKIRKAFYILVIIPLLGAFQNCGAPHHSDLSELSSTRSDSFNVGYPYLEKTNYFEDVQLVGKGFDTDTSLHSYEFVGVVVDIENEDTKLDVTFQVLDENDQVICTSNFTSVDRSENHLTLDICRSFIEYGELKVLVKASASGEIPQDIRTLDFDLSSLSDQ